MNTVEIAKATFVAAFWKGLSDYGSRLPPDSTFSLLSLPILTVPFLNVITSLWGAYLLYAVLYFFTGHATFRDMGLFWLLVCPAFFGWFFLVIALDVTFPFIDPVIIPVFFSGLALLIGYYHNYVTRGRFFDNLRQIYTRVLGLVLGKVRGQRVLPDTNYGL